MWSSFVIALLSLTWAYASGVLITAYHRSTVYKERIDKPWREAIENWDWSLSDRYEALARQWMENWLADCLNPLRWRSGWRAPELPVYGLTLVKPNREEEEEKTNVN